MDSVRMRPMLLVLLLCTVFASGGKARTFEWTTSSPEARKHLVEVQARIENFQFGNETIELARKVVQLDPDFAMGAYYLSAVLPPAEAQRHLDRAVELSAQAGEGDRRFIEAMVVVRANNGANFREGVPLLEKLAVDYPGERLTYALLGQIYQAMGSREKARSAFERAQEIGPDSNRIRSFLANDDLLEGRFEKARQAFLDIENSLPPNSNPFAIRYGTAFSYLYEEKTEAALSALDRYLTEYRESGANQNFPEVFILNSIARINLEAGRLDEAMRAYKSGYEFAANSSLDEDQKKLWLGRLHHGKCRVLAKLGKYEEASSEAKTVKKMIEAGGEAATQYLPAYHYLMGYLELERGNFERARTHLEQADLNDPFQKLLLARSYEGLSKPAEARKLYQEILESTNNGLERALAYPEARKRLAAL